MPGRAKRIYYAFDMPWLPLVLFLGGMAAMSAF
jgi:hypothetical protein